MNLQELYERKPQPKGRKTFANYPNQKTISVFQGGYEIETHKYETEQERDNIIKVLTALKIKRKNYFD